MFSPKWDDSWFYNFLICFADDGCQRDLTIGFLLMSWTLFSRQNNHWISQARSNLLKFSAQYSERGLCSVKFILSLWGPHHYYPRFIYIFHFRVIFFNWSPILDLRSPILIFQQTLHGRVVRQTQTAAWQVNEINIVVKCSNSFPFLKLDV